MKVTRLWVKEPNSSETVSAENCYLHRSMRHDVIWHIRRRDTVKGSAYCVLRLLARGDLCLTKTLTTKQGNVNNPMIDARTTKKYKKNTKMGDSSENGGSLRVRDPAPVSHMDFSRRMPR